MSWTGGTLHHINSVAATSLINSRVAVKGDRGGGTLVWDHRLDHTVFRSPLLAIVCLISHRVVVAFAIVWCPFVLSSRRSYSMYVPSNPYRLILVSISWARSSSPSHPTKTTRFLIQLYRTIPSPLSAHLPNHSVGHRVAFYTRSLSPPVASSFTSVTLCLFIAPYCTYH